METVGRLAASLQPSSHQPGDLLGPAGLERTRGWIIRPWRQQTDAVPHNHPGTRSRELANHSTLSCTRPLSPLDPLLQPLLPFGTEKLNTAC